MGLTHARPFIRAIVETASTSLVEHRDAFSRANIPESLLDNSYHIAPGVFVSNTRMQQAASIVRYRTVLSLFKRGFQDTSGAMDDIIDLGETLVEALLDPFSRTDNVKQVLYNEMRLDDLAVESDHIIVCEIDLDIDVILCANNV